MFDPKAIPPAVAAGLVVFLLLWLTTEAGLRLSAGLAMLLAVLLWAMNTATEPRRS